MTERERISLKAQSFFDGLWKRGDPWELETSDFERKRYARLIAMLDQSKYARILEIGCGTGAFTRLLAPMAQRLIALDVSSSAIAAARAAQGSFKEVEFRVVNVMDYEPKAEGPWDLIVMSETVYYLGWLYLQYIQGLHLLGHDVFYLEDTGNWVYNPELSTFTEDCSFNLQYLDAVLTFAVGPATTRRWSFRSPIGEYFGLSEREIETVCNQADLFINVSGCCWLRDRYQGCARKLYIDTDPLYTQHQLEAMRRGTATTDQAYSVNLICNHDLFFTFAENISDPSCCIPSCRLTLHTTLQPVVL